MALGLGEVNVEHHEGNSVPCCQEWVTRECQINFAKLRLQFPFVLPKLI